MNAVLFLFVFSLLFGNGEVTSRPSSKKSVKLKELREVFNKNLSEKILRKFSKSPDAGGEGRSVVGEGGMRYSAGKSSGITGRYASQERQNLFNPAISLLGIFLGGWIKEPIGEDAVVSELDPRETGFFLQKAELSFSADIDPYFTALAILGFRSSGEGVEFELEELYLQTLSLPWGLKLRLGKYLSEMSRLGSKHLHFLDFVEKPLAIVMAYGGESSWLGLELSWLLPLPFYLELVFDVGYGPSSAFPLADPGRPDLGGHIKGYIELSGEVGFLFGFGARNGIWVRAGGLELSKTILDSYIHLRWKSPVSYNYIAWMVEFLAVNLECASGVDSVLYCGKNLSKNSKSLWNFGGNAKLIWRFSKRWRTGIKLELLHLSGGVEDWGAGSRVGAILEFSPSEFSRLRVQFSALDIFPFQKKVKFEKVNFAAWIQLQFSMGVHGAHPY